LEVEKENLSETPPSFLEKKKQKMAAAHKNKIQQQFLQFRGG